MEKKKSDQYSVAFSVFWLTSSIFTTLALYDYMLRPYVSTLDNGLLPHTVGPTGFELAQLLVVLFGYGAFVLPVFLLFFCAVPLFNRRLDRLRLFNAVLIFILTVALLNLTVPMHTQDPFFTAGGILGKFINDYVYHYVDFTGSCLLIGALLLVCVEYQFRAFWRQLIAKLFTFLAFSLHAAFQMLSTLWRQTFSSVLQEKGRSEIEDVNFTNQESKPSQYKKPTLRTNFQLNRSTTTAAEPTTESSLSASRQSPILPSINTAKSVISNTSTNVSQKSIVTASSIHTQKKLTPEHQDTQSSPASPTIQSANVEPGAQSDHSSVTKKTSKETKNTVILAKTSDKPNTQSPEKNYDLAPPPLDLLNQDKLSERIKEDPQKLQLLAQAIEDKLKDFGVKAKVMNILLGPIITRFEIQPAPGTKASKITGLSRDLARSLSVTSVRVVEVIAGKTFIGLEIPNKNRVTVSLKTLFESHAFQSSKSALCLALGVDISGDPVVVDLAKMPHMLVAGTTGSGKSVGLNTMLLSLLYKTSPEDLKLILIDPKMLEFAVYEGIPHLLTSVVTDMNDASFALSWCVNEMERRYKLMAELGVRNIGNYNAKVKQMPDIETTQSHLNPGEPEYHKHLPYIVVIADEFADMMMMVGKKVETLIARLAQKARAAGIHLILATQRPSVDVITGLIKANIPTRISFQVSSKIDSRTILDQQGAESLLGSGDMLYLSPGSGLPIRCHGAFVSDEAIAGVVKHLRSLGKPDYIELHRPEVSDSPQIDMLMSDDKKNKDDALYDQIIDFVTSSRKVSTSSVQRRFRIGYNRAAVMVDRLEQEGVISPMDTNGQRQVLAPPPSKFDD